MTQGQNPEIPEDDSKGKDEDLKLFKSEGGGEDKKVKMSGGGVVPHLKMAGGGLVYGYNNGAKVVDNETQTGVVTDPEERQKQESYMLKYVNEERAFQGKPPLTELTYAPGVELTKMRGPGPRINETTNTNFDFDTGFKTTSTSKTVDGKMSWSGGMSFITPEEREKFFAENPHAQALLDIKNQAELDNLGADISASAKMNGGGIVPRLIIPKKFNKGGKVPGAGNKDTVPAMLTPGEFVMSKGAVEKYGTSTLASMNAMGGGNNTPEIVGTIKGFNQGGIVGKIRGVASGIRNTAKKLFNSVPDGGTPNVSILPVPSGGSGGASGGAGGGSGDNDVALFSPINHEDMQTLIVKNMYSILD